MISCAKRVDVRSTTCVGLSRRDIHGMSSSKCHVDVSIFSFFPFSPCLLPELQSLCGILGMHERIFGCFEFFFFFSFRYFLEYENSKSLMYAAPGNIVAAQQKQVEIVTLVYRLHRVRDANFALSVFM
jgi:hypothetical protein